MQSLWMLVASLLFALMSACVKLAGMQYSVAEIVFYRSLLGVVAMGIAVRMRGGTLATPVPWMHVGRATTGTAAVALWFHASMVLPLGTAMTLNYASSLYLAAAVVGVAFNAGRRVHTPLLGTLLVGFAGVVLVLQPSFHAEQAGGALAGFLSGLLSAMAYWHVKELGRHGEPAWRVVFYFVLTGSILGLIGVLFTGGFSSHSARGAALLVAIGVTATLAQLAMTRAYGAGRTLLTANLQYSAIVFAGLLGALVFADQVAPTAWAGMGLIVAGGIVATWLTARLPSAGSQRGADHDASASPPSASPPSGKSP